MRKRKLFKFAVLGVTSAFLVGQAALPFDALSSKVSADGEVNPKHLAIFMGDIAKEQPLAEAKPSLGGLGSLFAETFIGALKPNTVEDPNAPKDDGVEENLDRPTGEPEGVESPAPGEEGEPGVDETAPAPGGSEDVRAEEVDLDTLDDPIPANGPEEETVEPGGAPATGEEAPTATEETEVADAPQPDAAEEGELQAPEIKDVKFTRGEGKTTITVTATKDASIILLIGKDERQYAQGWAINGSVDFVFEQDIPENIKFAFIPIAYEKGENGAPDINKKHVEGKKYVALTAPMVLEVKTLKKPTEKVTPANPEKLTEEEKAAIKDNLNKANLNEDGDSTIPEGTEITVNDDGSVSIKFEGGAKQTILSKDTVKLAEEPKEETPEVVEEKQEENKSKVLSTGLELPRFVLSEDNKNDANNNTVNNNSTNNDEKTVENAEGKALPKTAVGGFAGLFGMASISLAGLFVGRRKNK